MRNVVLAVLVLGVLLVMAIAMAGCQKTMEERQMTYYRVSQEEIDVFALPIGSYFIYKDSTTGLEDSVVVAESSITKVFVPKHIGYMLFGLPPSMIPDSYSDSLVLTLTRETSNGPSNWLHIAYMPIFLTSSHYYDKDENGVERGIALTLPLIGVIRAGETEFILIPSMDVEGVTYKNVYRCLSSTGGRDNRQTDYYWAKGVGLIKKVFKTDTETHSWTLLRRK